jgi:hypothetical protein
MPDINSQIEQAKQALKTQGYPVDQGDIQPMGFLDKLMGNDKRTYATTSPWTGKVSYSPETLGTLGQNDINSTLAHELTHTKQVQNLPFMDRMVNGLKSFLPQPAYHDRPNEQEAFQAEKDYGLANHIPQEGDINLPAINNLRKLGR